MPVGNSFFLPEEGEPIRFRRVDHRIVLSTDKIDKRENYSDFIIEFHHLISIHHKEGMEINMVNTWVSARTLGWRRP